MKKIKKILDKKMENAYNISVRIINHQERGKEDEETRKEH